MGGVCPLSRRCGCDCAGRCRSAWIRAERSQEVGRGGPGRDDPLGVRHGSEELGFSGVGVFEDHDGGDVAAAVAVVGRRPDGHQLLVEHELVTFVDQLVGAADQLQVVDVNELQEGRREGGSRSPPADATAENTPPSEEKLKRV